jgi:prepilin-type N-terminal cleavage/methylation domain-containing protein
MRIREGEVMEESRSVARLRFVRDIVGRTASEDEGDAEAGFTLIELMVVLLIMGILLAIAIPTFLSVTGSANKTAAQSNLTDALTSATAIYTNTQDFPTLTVMNTKLGKTQNTIQFQTGKLTAAIAKGKNVISVDELTGSLVVMTALDGKTVCWVAALNEGGAALKGIPSGDQFYGVKTATACTPATMLTLAATSWKAAFSDIKTLT